jgi:hypothetical protein
VQAREHDQHECLLRKSSEDLIQNHLALYDYWDGIFYDVYTDGLRWMHKDVKDANRNGIPEYDDEQNGDEPTFSSLWGAGMVSLGENTISLDTDVILMGNGLHKGALDILNGKFTENFVKSSTQNIHSLSQTYRYIAEGSRQPRISIVNGWMKDRDPAGYHYMRFALGAALLIDAYYCVDFGSRSHGEILWFDEFSVRPDGDVDAAQTRLAENITAGQTTISVESTGDLEGSGVVEIEGERIYYESKDATHLRDCYRGYPNEDDLKSPHGKDSKVIQHFANHKGYLGEPLNPAYDANDPSVKLKELFEQCGWYPNEDQKEDINSRIWRRDFTNGTVLVNPTENSVLVPGLGSNIYKKINGLQDRLHNDGQFVDDAVHLASGDGYILIKVNDTVEDTIPPSPPEGLKVKP